ncbi:MAG: hypothetical protein JNK85_27110 [Verrucomicrobiales bacterium]|nr:hypothetical protein [Verrucomicrobiales bacterium]
MNTYEVADVESSPCEGGPAQESGNRHRTPIVPLDRLTEEVIAQQPNRSTGNGLIGVAILTIAVLDLSILLTALPFSGMGSALVRWALHLSFSLQWTGVPFPGMELGLVRWVYERASSPSTIAVVASLMLYAGLLSLGQYLVWTSPLKLFPRRRRAESANALAPAHRPPGVRVRGIIWGGVLSGIPVECLIIWLIGPDHHITGSDLIGNPPVPIFCALELLLSCAIGSLLSRHGYQSSLALVCPSKDRSGTAYVSVLDYSDWCKWDVTVILERLRWPLVSAWRLEGSRAFLLASSEGLEVTLGAYAVIDPDILLPVIGHRLTAQDRYGYFQLELSVDLRGSIPLTDSADTPHEVPTDVLFAAARLMGSPESAVETLRAASQEALNDLLQESLQAAGFSEDRWSAAALLDGVRLRIEDTRTRSLSGLRTGITQLKEVNGQGLSSLRYLTHHAEQLLDAFKTILISEVHPLRAVQSSLPKTLPSRTQGALGRMLANASGVERESVADSLIGFFGVRIRVDSVRWTPESQVIGDLFTRWSEAQSGVIQTVTALMMSEEVKLVAAHDAFERQACLSVIAQAERLPLLLGSDEDRRAFRDAFEMVNQLVRTTPSPTKP